MTYCGKSDASDLTVKRFGEKICSYVSKDYELACEHEHSCSVLIANKKFKKNGQ